MGAAIGECAGRAQWWGADVEDEHGIGEYSDQARQSVARDGVECEKSNRKADIRIVVRLIGNLSRRQLFGGRPG